MHGTVYCVINMTSTCTDINERAVVEAYQHRAQNWAALQAGRQPDVCLSDNLTETRQASEDPFFCVGPCLAPKRNGDTCHVDAHCSFTAIDANGIPELAAMSARP